jgi:hypothetical protein
MWVMSGYGISLVSGAKTFDFKSLVALYQGFWKELGGYACDFSAQRP